MLTKLVRRPLSDNLLLTQAVLLMAVSAALIAFVPFRKVAPLMDAGPRGDPPEPEARRRLVLRVRWAVVAASRRVPWRSMCFEQGLTAHRMLRARGVPTTLHYGVAQGEAGLEAHVWVRDGDQAVTGCEVAPRFTEMAMFPDPARPAA